MAEAEHPHEDLDLQHVLNELRVRVSKLEEKHRKLEEQQPAHMAQIGALELRLALLENRMAAAELLGHETFAWLDRMNRSEAGDDSSGDGSVGLAAEDNSSRPPCDSAGVATEGNSIRPDLVRVAAEGNSIRPPFDSAAEGSPIRPPSEPWAIGSEVLGDEVPPPWDIDCIPVYKGRITDPQEVIDRLGRMQAGVHNEAGGDVEVSADDEPKKKRLLPPRPSMPVQQKPEKDSAEDQLDKVPVFLTQALANMQPNSSKPAQQKPAEDSAHAEVPISEC